MKETPFQKFQEQRNYRETFKALASLEAFGRAIAAEDF